MTNLNISGMGHKQEALIERMAKENLVIRHWYNEIDLSNDISLMDEEGENTFSAVKKRMLISLYKRQLLNMEEKRMTQFVTLFRYDLKPEIAEYYCKVR